MSLESWMLIWKWTLAISLALFTLMTAVVTIGSIFDIRRLFQRLREDAAVTKVADSQTGRE